MSGARRKDVRFHAGPGRCSDVGTDSSLGALATPESPNGTEYGAPSPNEPVHVIDFVSSHELAANGLWQK